MRANEKAKTKPTCVVEEEAAVGRRTVVVAKSSTGLVGNSSGTVSSSSSSSSSNSSSCCCSDTEESTTTTTATAAAAAALAKPPVLPEEETAPTTKRRRRTTGLAFESAPAHRSGSANRPCRERPSRIEAIRRALRLRRPESSSSSCSAERRPTASSLYDRCRVYERLATTARDDDDADADFDDDENDAVLAAVEARVDEVLRKVHHEGYVRRLENLLSFSSSSSGTDGNGRSDPSSSSSSCCCGSGRIAAVEEEERITADEITAENLRRVERMYDSVYLTERTFVEARRAAAAVCVLVDQVVAGRLDNGFAAVRPPGHHAQAGSAGGYCVVNNVAVAAQYARTAYPDAVRKVLVVDYDVHHGNGTQSIFLDDPNVLYFSVHRWHAGNYFPHDRASGSPEAVGVRGGRGYTVNVGWTRRGMGDAEYRRVWRQLLLPVAREFNPDLVLVSAGFDAARGDDVGECDVTPECFGELTRSLLSLARGRVVCALEGGYVGSVLGRCVESVVRALLYPIHGDEDDDTANSSVDDDDESKEDEDDDGLVDPIALKNIQSTVAAHRGYWKCLADKA